MSNTEKQDARAGRITSNDVFANPDTRALTALPTAVDAAGVERVAGPPLATFVPAPTEATPEQIKAAKDRNKLYEDAADARQSLLRGDAEKAKNNPADGGSQTATT